MIHSERDNCCVCPQCLYRCYACQGMGAGLTREEARMLRQRRLLKMHLRNSLSLCLLRLL